jgi:hypothetical protein
MGNPTLTCRKVVEAVKDALACGVVDLDTATLAGVHHTVLQLKPAYLDSLAAATVEMFRGKDARQVEDLLSKHGGEAVKDSVEEVFVSSPGALHFMKLVREKHAVVVLVSQQTTNRGMGWAVVRNAVREISAELTGGRDRQVGLER